MLILLLISPAAFAHGIPAQAMVIILIVWPTIITAMYGLIVLFLRWKQLFKYQWLTIISYILAIGTLGLLAVSVVVFGSVIAELFTGEQNYFSDHYIQLFLLFLVVILHAGIVTWLFRVPIKQYKNLAGKTNETANSINEALGIKTMKGDK
jgi:hypothetical protein